MWSSLLIEGTKSLTVGLNNLKVIGLTLLHRSRLSLTVTGMNLLLEGLSEPSVMYECFVAYMVRDFAPFGIAGGSRDWKQFVWCDSI